MRVSLIPEEFFGKCYNFEKCGWEGQIRRYTICLPNAAETTEPLCPQCEAKAGELVVEPEVHEPSKVAPPNRRVKKASLRNERRVAEGIGGRAQPGSGNQAGAKGDVRKRGIFRIENKDTYSNQFILRKEILDKIWGECDGKEKPAVILSFMEKNTHRLRESWAIIPYVEWEKHAAGQDR